MKIKRIRMLALVMAFFMLASLVSCGALLGRLPGDKLGESGEMPEEPLEQEPAGENIKWKFNEANGTLTISGNGAMENYEKDVNNVVGSPWWEHTQSIRKVVIKNGVLSIGNYAFYDCKNLTKIEFAKTLETIGKGAFCGCENLREISLPANLKKLGAEAFLSTGLERVVIPEGVTTVEGLVFSFCNSLTSVEFPDSVTSVGSGVVLNSEKVKFNEKDGVSYLGNAKTPYLVAAVADKNLTRVVLPDTVKILLPSLFRECKKLESVDLSERLLYIDSYTFKDCERLREIVIPESVTSLGDSAFSGCAALECVTLGKGLKSIGWNAFADCAKLPSIELPASLTRIESDAFLRCTNLAAPVLPEGLTYLAASAFDSSLCRQKDGLLFLGSATNPYFALMGASDSKITSLVVPEATKLLATSAFSHFGELKSVKIPQGITEIPGSLFFYCYRLEEVQIPEGVTTIGISAFSDCKALRSVVLPDSVATISIQAFENCESLKSITLGKGVEVIGARAFNYCEQLTDIVIPEGVKSIGQGAFSGCFHLEKITLPVSLRSVGKDIFGKGQLSYCYELKNIYYAGTTQQWREIQGIQDVRMTSGPKIHCSNGEAN